MTLMNKTFVVSCLDPFLEAPTSLRDSKDCNLA